MTAEEFWSKVKEHYLKMPEVLKQGEALKINKKMFCMFSHGDFVVKLPNKRVEELISSGNGFPYDPGNGKIMKEWAIIPEKYANKWIEYALEAKTFALTLAK
jgi:hypothetical protein